MVRNGKKLLPSQQVHFIGVLLDSTLVMSSYLLIGFVKSSYWSDTFLKNAFQSALYIQRLLGLIACKTATMLASGCSLFRTGF